MNTFFSKPGVRLGLISIILALFIVFVFLIARSTLMPSPAAVATLLRIANSKVPRSEEGQDLLEYGLLAALIAVFALGAVAALGNTISAVFWTAIANSF